MVSHVLQYRLKCYSRDRQMLFWTLVFPLMLATLFHLAFANLVSIEQFLSIRIAVVDNAAYRQNVAFQAALSGVSTDHGEGDPLFEVTLTDQPGAQKLLEDRKIDGYIEPGDSLKLVVQKTGLNQTIIKSFLDNYQQTVAAVEQVIAVDPSAWQTGMIDRLLVRADYLQAKPVSQAAADPAIIYFYSLLAMTALYGGFWGMRVVTDLQANQSPQGARISVAPVHKMKLLLVDIAAAFTIQYTLMLIVLAFIGLVLKYSFGDQLGLVFLTALAGSFMGVSLGASIAAVIKQREGIKTGILISVSMLMSFFSGMMYHGIKYLVVQAVPAMAWLNPANLMTDAFYALYYGSVDRCLRNIGGLFAYGAIFCLVAYAVLRRQKYASL